jgi:tetratricopeptide (TPR) repeat protein
VRFEWLRAHAGDALARAGVPDLAELRARRIADADVLRAALGPGELLEDDRPRLELWSARQRAGAAAAGGLEVLEPIAAEAARRDAQRGAFLLFVQSLAARARGDAERSDRLEALAEQAGLALARAARIERAAEAAGALFRADRLAEAAASFQRVLVEAPAHAGARFGLAASLFGRGEREAAREELERLVVAAPDHAEGWNLLGALRAEAGDRPAARRAFERALAADPWYPEAHANLARLGAAAGG